VVQFAPPPFLSLHPAAVKMLDELGVPKENIMFDDFGA
jgi:Na+-transporting NADH:ubiquinone oxidoreductase subunit NqrF